MKQVSHREIPIEKKFIWEGCMDLTRDLGTDSSEFGSMKRQIRPYFKIRMQGNLRHRYVKRKMTHITVEQYVMTFKGI